LSELKDAKCRDEVNKKKWIAVREELEVKIREMTAKLEVVTAEHASMESRKMQHDEEKEGLKSTLEQQASHHSIFQLPSNKSGCFTPSTNGRNGRKAQV
jgi:hypothetical protein